MAPLLWASDPAGQLFDWKAAAGDHEAIVTAIVAGDEQAAQAAALQHCLREAEAVINTHLDLVMSQSDS
jgi:GntR family transcriptional regulator, transcriptional repressor for pyruvate dehydrogenase complex